jgi:glycosyltransferase involved in cell wall biosynthesis
MPRTLVVVATYNERENIEALVGALLGLGVSDLDVLIVDDNSPDGTGALADQLAARHPQVRVLHREGKLGLGTAHGAGVAHARRHGYDFVVTMDADFSHNPAYLPQLIAGMADHDIMIGSRYVPGGATRHWGRIRRLMSWGANAFVRLLLGLRPRDCSGGYRCYRVALVSRVDPADILARGYAFQEEMLYRCQRLGARIGEVPIVFENRQRGQTKMSFREIWGLGTTVLRLRWRKLTGRLGPRPPA